jgi:hypothetical protein
MVNSRCLVGLQAPAVTVEVHLANGLPSFTLVGLADTEVKEARERAEQGLGMTLAEGGETHHTVAWQAHTVLADALEGMGDVRGALVALRAANARR